MEDFLNVMALVFEFLRFPINLYGFTFSFWDVILLVLITGCIISAIRILYGG